MRRRIGFLPDTPPLYNEMTVGRYLAFVGAAARRARRPRRRRPSPTPSRRRRRATSTTHLISSLSHGYRQRVGVAQALVHRPKLLILDEPTSGLDPVQIVEMRNMIRELRGAHTILLSSHILSEISQTCDRLLVIQRGEIVAQGTEQDLAQAPWAAAARSRSRWRRPSARAIEVARSVEGVGEVTRPRARATASRRCRFRAAPELRPRLARALVQNGVDLLRIDRGAARLESIFIQLTKDRTAGD